jgi:predicted ATPase
MLERSTSSFREQPARSQIIFCDRGIPDTLAYSRLIGRTDADAVAASVVYRYARRVFLAPAWHAIYATDKERKQSFEEAVKTCDLIAKTYEECGYEIVELPLSSPTERSNFISERVPVAAPA